MCLSRPNELSASEFLDCEINPLCFTPGLRSECDIDDVYFINDYTTNRFSTRTILHTRFHVWLRVKLVLEGDQDKAGVTACQDPRIQLSFTVLCGRHWPLPGHAVICLACKHVTIFPEVYNLAKTG